MVLLYVTLTELVKIYKILSEYVAYQEDCLTKNLIRFKKCLSSNITTGDFLPPHSAKMVEVDDFTNVYIHVVTSPENTQH